MLRCLTPTYQLINKLQRGLERMEKVIFRGSSGSVRVLLHNLLPNYQGSLDREQALEAVTGE